MIEDDIIFEIKKKARLLNQDVAFLCGSIIEGQNNKFSEGMGNSTSDIDLYIIRDSNDLEKEIYEINSMIYKSNIFSVSGYSIDVKIFNYNDISELVTSFSNIVIKENTRIENSFIPPEKFDVYSTNSFVHRINHSICINNKDKFKYIRDSIIKSKWNSLMILHNQNKIDSSYEDVIGNLEESNIEVALYSIRKMFYYAVGIYLYHMEDSYDREKWVCLKLLNYHRMQPSKANEILVNIYEEIVLMKKEDNRNLEDKIIQSTKEIDKFILNI